MAHWKELVGVGPVDLRIAALGPEPEVGPLLQMFRQGAKHEGLSLHLEHIEVPKSEFREALGHLASIGVRGVSVSGPLKVDAAMVAERFFVSTQALGVANTLLLENGIWAQNTEVAAVTELIRGLEAGTALILGAGPGARSVVGALMQAGWKVRLWNRNAVRARPLLTMMQRYGQVELMPTPDPAGCRLIVNATPLGSKPGEEPPLQWAHVARGATVLDLVYRRVATEFLRQARVRGLRAIDGRQLLAEQAAISFEWWVGHPVAREPMREALGLRAVSPTLPN
jgi:shikimate dehydrogenase